MKLAVIYFSKTGNTKTAGELIARGMETVAGAEAALFPVDAVDGAYLAGARAVVFGAPTYYADACWQMERFLQETALPLAGKLGAAFATANNMQGGSENTLRSLLTCMMARGMLCFSGGTALGRPFTHLGAVALAGRVEEQGELFTALGARVAGKAAELFRV